MFARLHVLSTTPEQSQRGLELVRLNLRQEADLPEVHAENGDVHLGDGSGRTQECPVSAQDGENVARLQLR